MLKLPALWRTPEGHRGSNGKLSPYQKEPGAALLYSFNKQASGFYKLEIAVPAGDSSSGIKEATLLMEITSQFRKKEKDRLMDDVSEKN